MGFSLNHATMSFDEVYEVKGGSFVLFLDWRISAAVSCSPFYSLGRGRTTMLTSTMGGIHTNKSGKQGPPRGESGAHSSLSLSIFSI